MTSDFDRAGLRLVSPAHPNDTPLYTVDPAVLSALLQRHDAMADALWLIGEDCKNPDGFTYRDTLERVEAALAALDREDPK